MVHFEVPVVNAYTLFVGYHGDAECETGCAAA